MLGLSFEVSALRVGRRGKGIPTTNFTPSWVPGREDMWGFIYIIASSGFASGGTVGDSTICDLIILYPMHPKLSYLKTPV